MRLPGSNAPLAAPVLIAAQYLSEGNGGIAVVARLTAKALAGRPAGTVTALACMDRTDFRVHGVPVAACAGSRLRFVGRMVAGAHRAGHVVHDFAGTARTQSLLVTAGARHVVWAHGEEVWGRPRRDYVAALARADLVLVNSHHTMARAADALGGCRRVALCRLATETDEPPPPRPPRDGPPTVLLLGRVDHGFPKGHDLLVAAWPRVRAAVPDARLVFAGGGAALDDLRALVRTAPEAGSITVAGHAPIETIDQLWAATTVLAMPSRGEGFGLVFIEAMRRGVPVITSTEDAGQEVAVDGRTGFAVDRGHPDRLVEALVALLADRDRAAALGAAGQAHWAANHRFIHFEAAFRAATAAVGLEVGPSAPQP